jgi:amino acid transporter
MKPETPSSTGNAARHGSLGTFAGVFTPSILTILGIILFLRLGYVVGAGGLEQALIILLLANGISVLTSLSLSAVATNLRIKRGGDYYLISRTLGFEFGGAIGLVMFIAQSVSVGFYCIGFAEVLVTLLPPPLNAHPHIAAAFAALPLFLLAWLGADWATRFQYLVMATLAAALGSFFIGAALHWDTRLLGENWSASPATVDFWVLFALFFPAVTGFTQGVSMSGDLQDPGRSLPLGTLTAVGISILIYLFAALALAGSLPQQILVDDYSSMNRVAVFEPLVIAGVFAATLSSAMASFMGAPRILQSLAGDHLFRWLIPFAKGSGTSNNPRRGILLTALLAMATISLGQLNLIAPVVSMFFLISYGLINYATYFEARAATPWFRPRFRFFHRNLSLLGALACLAAMLAIDIDAGLIAVALMFAIYHYLRHTVHHSRWADGRRSFHTQQIRTHLLAAALEPEHPRDWRPNILLFSDNRERRLQLLRLADWFNGDSGFATAVKIVEGQGAIMQRQKEESQAELEKDIRKSGTEVFPLALLTPDLDTGLKILLQGFGIGHLKANIVMLNWLDASSGDQDGQRELTYGRHLRTAYRQGCNLVILDGNESEWENLALVPAAQRRIDVWWRNDATSRLMLLLAHLLTRSEAWYAARIRLLGMCTERKEADTLAMLQETLQEIRIDADVLVVQQPDAEAVIHHSRDASLVFLPFHLHGNQPLGPFDGPLERLLEPLPLAIISMAAEDIELDAEPEEGVSADAARLLDTLSDAEHFAGIAARDAKDAENTMQKVRDQLLQQNQTDPEKLAKLEQQLSILEAQTEKARRRAARSAAKALAARNDAIASGLIEDESKENSIS